jgi:hypothetical protein
MSLKKGFMLLGLCLGVGITNAQGICPSVVATALSNITQDCTNTARNQVCYGNVAVTGEGRVPNFVFEQVGDIVNVADVQRLTLTPYSEDPSEWGIALLKLQANLPDTLPGENVTVLAFGDVQLDNAIERVEPVTATLTGNGRARIQPVASGDVGVINAIPAGTIVEVLGRNEEQDWLYVKLGDFAKNNRDAGWVSTQVLQVSGNIEALPIIPSADSLAEPAPLPATPNPMSAFYMRSGVGDSPCAEVSQSGLLVQTPQGGQSVTFRLNEIDVNLGSTVFFSNLDAQTLGVYVLEGSAILSVADDVVFVPAGTFSTVPLTADGNNPSDAPTPPQPYDLDTLSNLPLAGLATTIEVATPVPSDNIETVIAETFAPNGAVPGQYAYENTTNCNSISRGAETFVNSNVVSVRVEAGSIVMISPNGANETVYSLGGDGRYYFDVSFSSPSSIALDGTQLFTSTTSSFVLTLTSSTQFTSETNSQTERPLYTAPDANGNVRATGEYETAVCNGRTTYIWQSF